MIKSAYLDILALAQRLVALFLLLRFRYSVIYQIQHFTPYRLIHRHKLLPNQIVTSQGPNTRNPMIDSRICYSSGIYQLDLVVTFVRLNHIRLIYKNSVTFSDLYTRKGLLKYTLLIHFCSFFFYSADKAQSNYNRKVSTVVRVGLL